MVVLRNAGYGRYIGNVFQSALTNADNLVIIASSAMQAMLKLCGNFANDQNINTMARNQSFCLLVRIELVHVKSGPLT